jgi:hypothetical protein
MTFFFFFDGWHCRFFTERWQLLPKRLIFRDAASIMETARRGDGLIDNEVTKALDRSIKIGKGGIMLRLSNEQFLAIAGVLLPSAAPNVAGKTGSGAENISPEIGSSPNLPSNIAPKMAQNTPAEVWIGATP